MKVSVKLQPIILQEVALQYERKQEKQREKEIL